MGFVYIGKGLQSNEEDGCCGCNGTRMVMQVCFGFSGVDGWSLKKMWKGKLLKMVVLGAL